MAMESLKKAKAALPATADILLALGKLYYENERPTEAISVLKQAFQLNPDEPEIRKSLAKAYLTHGYLNEAWSVISPLENDYTSDPDLALTLGKVMVALGDYQAPKPVLRFAWHSSKSDEALKAYANLLLKQAAHGDGIPGADNKDSTCCWKPSRKRPRPKAAPLISKCLLLISTTRRGRPKPPTKPIWNCWTNPKVKPRAHTSIYSIKLVSARSNSATRMSASPRYRKPSW
jgi:Flp pilus assembly protein TadD